MARRSRPSGPQVKVQLSDPRLNRSRTLTVYGPELESLAREVQSFLAGRWRTTRLDDGRHQRR